jgi:uncharacterized membrane protein
VRNGEGSQPGDALGRAGTSASVANGAWPVRARSRRDGALALAVVLAFAWAAASATLAVRKHHSFHSNAYDLGLQQHVVWNTAHGRWFQYTYMVAFNPDLVNHLGDHVNLVLLPIAALYFVHDGPETLLVVQALAVASGMVPLFLIARRRIGHDGPALALASLYLLHPALQAALLFDFHPIVLAAPLFLWSYFFAVVRRDGWLVLATILLLATQENAALVVALLGALVAIEGRGRAGAALLAAGVGWFVVCYFAILPALNPGVGSNAFARYRHLGSSWSEVMTRVLLHPVEVATQVLDTSARAYLGALLVPFGFVSLLAPEILLCAATEVGLNLLSDFPAQRTIDHQYASVTVAVAALAAVVGAGRAARFAGARLGMPPAAIAWSLAAWAIAATAVFQARSYGTIRALGREYAGVYTDSAHARLGREMLARIPAGVAVSAQGTIAPHVSRRPRVYVFPTVADAEWVALDRHANRFPVHLMPLSGLTPEESYREYVQRLTASGDFRTVADADGWMLLRRLRPPAAVVGPEDRSR